MYQQIDFLSSVEDESRLAAEAFGLETADAIWDADKNRGREIYRKAISLEQLV